MIEKQVNEEFIIINSENGVTDVEFECRQDQHMASLTWCEENCNNYSFCQRIADANDTLVEWETQEEDL